MASSDWLDSAPFKTMVKLGGMYDWIRRNNVYSGAQWVEHAYFLDQGIAWQPAHLFLFLHRHSTRFFCRAPHAPQSVVVPQSSSIVLAGEGWWSRPLLLLLVSTLVMPVADLFQPTRLWVPLGKMRTARSTKQAALAKSMATTAGSSRGM